jgi:carbon-monoxide dehydrogenase large subunit
VVAATLAGAKDAAEQVVVDYEPLPAVAHALAAVEPAAPTVRRNFPNVILDGDVGDPMMTEAAFARAAHVVRLDTWVPRIAGVPMEPRAAVGEYDPQAERYTLYAGAGGAVSPRRDLAAVLGVSPEQVRVVMQDVGGNFGTRGSFSAEFALVVWAAKRLGRPVKWTSDRQEYFVADYQGADLAVSAELALDADGKFLAMRGSNLVNQGAYALAFGPLNKGSRSCRASTMCRPCISADGGADQHDPDSALSQLRPAGGHVRDGEAGRSGGDRDRHRPHRTRRQSRAGINDAVHQPVRHGL